jgi:SnoaL-like protein
VNEDGTAESKEAEGGAGVESPPRTVDQLLAIEAIKQVKAEYFYFMDTKQWDSWREVFTEDVRIEGGPPQQSRDDFVGFVSRHLEGAKTCHHGYMPIIEVTSETSARGTWSMSDDVVFPAGHPWAADHPRQRGYGHYHEEYRRDGGRWRISAMRLTRLALWCEPDHRVDLLGRASR